MLDKKNTSKIVISAVLSTIFMVGFLFLIQNKKAHQLETSIMEKKNDLNNNGIRDDVDVFIDSKSYSTDQKTALKIYANKLEEFMSATNDNEINLAANEIKASLKSYYSEFGANDDPLNEIKDRELDTKERIRKYVEFTSKLKGNVY